MDNVKWDSMFEIDKYRADTVVTVWIGWKDVMFFFICVFALVICRKSLSVTGRLQCHGYCLGPMSFEFSKFCLKMPLYLHLTYLHIIPFCCYCYAILVRMSGITRQRAAMVHTGNWISKSAEVYPANRPHHHGFACGQTISTAVQQNDIIVTTTTSPQQLMVNA